MCGDDGCNGSCGTCGKVESCQNFKCTCSTDGGFEPNNTCTKPVSVMPGTYPNLSICTGGDQDWYLFSLLPGQTAKVQILFKQVDGDLDLYLYKQGNCSGYLANSASSTDNEELSYKSATQSSYLIRVVGYSANVSNSYTLVLTVQ
jgi:hypothetical protein